MSIHFNFTLISFVARLEHWHCFCRFINHLCQFCLCFTRFGWLPDLRSTRSFHIYFLFLFLRWAETGQHVVQHFDQHRLTNMLASMLVRFTLCTNMLEKEKIKEKCWPTFLKKLRNVGQQICKNGLNWDVCTVCGASQHVDQHGIFFLPFKCQKRRISNFFFIANK